MRALLSTLVISVLALAIGCGGSNASGEGGTADTLTIWWAKWAPADGLQELAADYSAETGVEVEIIQIPWPTYQDQVFLNFASGDPEFDVVIGDSQWLGRGAENGLYLELTDWLPEAVELEHIHPKALTYLCEYPTGSGRYWAAPCETDAVGFAYRRDWFEDAEERSAFDQRYGYPLAAPETWAQFRDIAEFFHRPEEQRYGCVLLTGRGYDSLVMGFQQVMWAFGGAWGDREAHTVGDALAGEQSVEALEFYRSLLDFAPTDGANTDYVATMQYFQNGSTAMAMDFFAFFPDIANHPEVGEVTGFFRMPAHDDRRVVSLGGQGFSIAKQATPAAQQRAKDFIAWFLTREVQERWVEKPAGFTADTRILGSDSFRAATPYNAAFADSLDHLRDFWNVPVYNELLAVATRRLGAALDGSISSADALQALAEEHQRILEQAGLGE